MCDKNEIYIPADMPYKNQIEHVINNKASAIIGYLGLAQSALENDQCSFAVEFMKKATKITFDLSKQIGVINAEQN